jgi:hypothetical protein
MPQLQPPIGRLKSWVPLATDRTNHEVVRALSTTVRGPLLVENCGVSPCQMINRI